MTKISSGNQYDDSISKNEIVASPGSDLEVSLGDQHDRSKRELNVREAVHNAETIPPHANQERFGGDGSATGLWAKGSFFLVSFITVGAVIGILAYKLPWYLVPLSVVGSIIVLYLLATVLLPNGPLTEKGLLSVLQAYVRLAFTASLDPKGKSAALPKNMQKKIQ